jgi:hypothetical protein
MQSRTEQHDNTRHKTITRQKDVHRAEMHTRDTRIAKLIKRHVHVSIPPYRVGGQIKTIIKTSRTI